MRFLKLPLKAKKYAQWRAKRNHIICRLLEADKHLSQKEALAIANRLVGRMPRGKGDGIKRYTGSPPLSKKERKAKKAARPKIKPPEPQPKPLPSGLTPFEAERLKYIQRYGHEPLPGYIHEILEARQK